MEIRFNVVGARRKELVNVISDVINCSVYYKGAPTFAYEIGSFLVDGEGTVTFNGTMDSDLQERLRGRLAEQGFEMETQDGITIEVPLDGFTEQALENLEKLIASKANLIKKAIGADDLPVERTETTLKFPWFPLATGDEAEAYSLLIEGLCKLAKKRKRITAKEKPVENEKYAFRVFLIQIGFVVMAIGTILYTIAFGTISELYHFENNLLIFFYTLSIGFQYFYGVIARAMLKNTLFVMSGCVNSLVMIVMNVVLIVFLDRGVEALYLSSLVGNMLQILTIHSQTKPFKHIKWNLYVKVDSIKEYIRFSTPLSVATVSHWLLNGLTQLVISVQLGVYANGLFTVANKFASMLILLVGIFQFAWNEMAYVLSDRRNKSDYYRKSITEILRISILGTAVILLVIRLIFPYFVGIQYHEVLNLIPIVVIGTAANSYSGFLGTIFLANKNSTKLFITTFISSLMNIIGLGLLTPKFGIAGAVSSLCIAFIIGAVSRSIMLNKSEGLKPAREGYLPIVLLIASLLVFYTVDDSLYLLGILCLYIVISLVLLKTLISVLLESGRSKLKKSRDRDLVLTGIPENKGEEQYDVFISK